MAARNMLPVFHYLDIGRMGRGQVLFLFLKDAGIEVQDVRYAYDGTWSATSKELQQTGITRTGKLPALEYNGSIFTQHIPTLRYLARDIGGYDGETNHEKYIVDAVSDIYIDWRFQWAKNTVNKTDECKNTFVPKHYNTLATYYDDRGGPYLLGDKITYADFAVYQSLDSDRRGGTLPEQLPSSLLKFREKFETRPRLAAYFKESL